MKYFDMEIRLGSCFSIGALEQATFPGFAKHLNFTEKFSVLEEECRAIGLQPVVSMDYTSIIIQQPSRKFIERRGVHKRCLAKRAIEYMAFCDKSKKDADMTDIKIIGLEAASAATVNWPCSGYVTIIRYDPDTGEVWASDATADQLAGRYDVFRTTRHMTTDQIRDAIHRHLAMARDN